jgi:hypothetical protein
MQQLDLFASEPISIKSSFTDWEVDNQQFCEHRWVACWGKTFEFWCRDCSAKRPIDLRTERYLLEEQISRLEAHALDYEEVASRTRNQKRAKDILKGAENARRQIEIVKAMLNPPVITGGDTIDRDKATGGDTNTGGETGAIATEILTPPVKQSTKSDRHPASGYIQIRKSQGKYPQAFYHWEEWNDGKRSKRCKYLSKDKIEIVRAAISRSESIETILKLLVGN